MTVAQFAFMLLLLGAIGLIRRRVLHIKRAISQGKPDTRPLMPLAQRLGHVLRLALGQKRMFDKPIAGVLHGLVYMGFFIINIELLEFVIDGLTGSHRFFAPYLGAWYGGIITALEGIALLVLGACVVFLLRRSVWPIPRVTSAELKGWPARDAKTILWFEIVLVVAFILFNALDGALQQHGVWAVQGDFYISQLLIPWVEQLTQGSTMALIISAKVAWWVHIIGVVGFAYYVTFSKHLHIVLAFVSTYYHRKQSTGEITVMPVVLNSLLSMLKPQEAGTEAPSADDTALGAQEVTDLTQQQLLEAYSCTECGRCTEVCPANQTGKLLSPRQIMMAVRDRAEDYLSGKAREKTLLKHYISYESLNACTTCQACVWACPIELNPLDIIINLRRYVAMETADVPSAWQQMYAHIENNGAPWPFPAHARGDWAKEGVN